MQLEGSWNQLKPLFLKLEWFILKNICWKRCHVWDYICQAWWDRSWLTAVDKIKMKVNNSKKAAEWGSLSALKKKRIPVTTFGMQNLEVLCYAPPLRALSLKDYALKMRVKFQNVLKYFRNKFWSEGRYKQTSSSYSTPNSS